MTSKRRSTNGQVGSVFRLRAKIPNLYMDHEQNDEIRRQSSERFSIYRRCKVEDIELPLESGSLKNVPLEEVSCC
jgi:hypothetical protein